MGLFTLFELFLVSITIYAIFEYEGGMRILVPILCLVVVFIFERLQERLKEEAEAKKRLLKYKLENHKKDSIEENTKGIRPIPVVRR